MEITGVSIRALGVALSSAFGKGLDGVEPTWGQVATMVPSNTSANDYAWLAQFPGMRRWIGERLLKELSGYDYTLKNELFEDTVVVPRTNIEDDNVGMYSTMATAAGKAAGAWPDELVWPLLAAGFSSLCYDGQNFFDTDHPVINPETGEPSSVSNMQAGAGVPWFLLDTSKPLKPFIFQQRLAPEFESKDDPSSSDIVFLRDLYLYGIRSRGSAGYGYWQMAFGSKAELTAANFDAARLAMAELKGDEGRPINMKATHIVVPPSLEGKAEDILAKKSLANGEDNTNYQRVKIITSPWLA